MHGQILQLDMASNCTSPGVDTRRHGHLAAAHKPVLYFAGNPQRMDSKPSIALRSAVARINLGDDLSRRQSTDVD